MPQSLSQVWLHVVFSTKGRRPFLQAPDFRQEMFGMLGHHVNQTGCTALRVGGWIDHVHIVCGLSRTATIADLVQQAKIETSKWAKSAPLCSQAFTWQAGYGAFSVSQSNLEQTVAYVQNQEYHHRTRSYQDEFRELCHRHQIQIDERYVWD
ncbi:MAG: transposase [Planctomycetaceae bacterium]